MCVCAQSQSVVVNLHPVATVDVMKTLCQRRGYPIAIVCGEQGFVVLDVEFEL